MNTSAHKLGVVLTSVLAVAACGGAPVGEEENLESIALANNAGGTWMSVTGSLGAVQCVGAGQALVTVSGVVSSGARAPTDVTVSINGGAAQFLDDIAPQEFSTGVTKTHSYTYAFTLGNGTHSIELCFSQPAGNDRMTECVTVSNIVVSCAAPSACATTAPFGSTVGNQNLCSGAGTPNIQVQAKGDFGNNAQLTVSGPNGFGFSAPIPRSGESCVYHYNWVTRNNNHGGPGTYSFTVSGTGSGGPSSVNWSAVLFCR